MTSLVSERKLRRGYPCKNCNKPTGWVNSNTDDIEDLCKTCTTMQKLKLIEEERDELSIGYLQRKFYITRERAIKLINYYKKTST